MNTPSFKEDYVDQLPVTLLMKTIIIDKKKPHFVSEVRNLRHCDWVNKVTRQVHYNFCRDEVKVTRIE